MKLVVLNIEVNTITLLGKDILLRYASKLILQFIIIHDTRLSSKNKPCFIMPFDIPFTKLQRVCLHHYIYVHAMTAVFLMSISLELTKLPSWDLVLISYGLFLSLQFCWFIEYKTRVYTNTFERNTFEYLRKKMGMANITHYKQGY